MRTNFVVLFGLLFVCFFSSCSSESVDEQSLMEDQFISVSKTYENAKINVYQSFAYEYIGVIMSCNNSKSGSNHGIIDVLLSFPVQKLDSILDNCHSTMVEYMDDTRKELAYDVFFERFSAYDFSWLRNSLDAYLEIGGHNPVFLEELVEGQDRKLSEMLILACAYADCLAGKNFWKEKEEGGKSRGVYLSEYECRKLFKAELELIATDFAVDSLISTAFGAVPEGEVLDFIAGSLGCVDAVLHYKECVDRANGGWH